MRQRGVERARRVALAEDEPVTLGEQRMHRIDVKYGCVKRHQDVSDREVAAEVTEPGPVDHVQVVAADAVGHLAQDRRGLRRCQLRELRAQGHGAESSCRISRQHVNIDSGLIFYAQIRSCAGSPLVSSPAGDRQGQVPEGGSVRKAAAQWCRGRSAEARRR